MKRDIFICSKPLQYFNLRNIAYEHADAEKILIIHGRFIQARTFFERVKQYDSTWDRVVFVRCWAELYTYLFFHPAQRLIAENDKSFVYGIFHVLRRFRQLYIFEEGFGSYRTDRVDDSKGLKFLINRLTGVGRHVGFSSFLSGQYLYLPELYKRQFPDYQKPLYSFASPFVDRLFEELPLFMQLSDGYDEFIALKDQKIAIYLTSHVVNSSMIKELKSREKEFDITYVKPHPHLKDLDEFRQYNLPVIRSNIMMEFLFVLLLKNNNQLTVFHENSTSVIWFQNKIECINMGAKFQAYDIVADYVIGNEK